ncbi:MULTISPECIES: hypothetical protein [Asticcacaulis]|uniref:hypothetical protein n=1 Tax=Asticcacaulis TaxID=76890 RepID=UPI001AE3DA10|nr:MULTISPECIES: hypothetical protein [Asticcacaulis]MBP2161277.1 hypothetical protein [Asticcacaulis solisilvae]MDR6802357.1 hypothetical protein [Asticcacaulis sp. BE141]
MTHTSSNSHIPYAIRYMARLQEQAAQTVVSEDIPADRLEKCAAHLRETVHLIERARPRDEVATQALPQKIKLLNFLRRQGLAR